MIRGVGGVVGDVVKGFMQSEAHNMLDDPFHTPAATTPHQASPVPRELDTSVADIEFDRLNEWWERESRKSQKSESVARSVREDLEEVNQQQNVLLPLVSGGGSSPAPSYGSIAGSSPAAPTNY